MAEPKEKKEYKSVKVPQKTYDQLKAMGQGYGKALEVIVESQKQAIEQKVTEIGEIGRRLYEEVLAKGLFNIKIAGVRVGEVREDGNNIFINLEAIIEVPDVDARRAIMDAVKPKESVKEEVKSE
jgi:hypothetical protein